MQVLGLSRRTLIISAAVAGTALLVALSLLVIYPRVGAWMIRGKLGGKLAAKLGREVRFGAIDVSLGHAVLHDVEIRGPVDGDTPLVHVDRIDVDFDAWRSLIGSVKLGAAKVDGVVVTLRRDAEGHDNVRDVVDRLQAKPAGGAPSSGEGMRPTAVTVTHARLLADDQVTGATALVGDGGLVWKPGELTAEVRGVSATTINAAKAAAATISVHKLAGQPPTVQIEGGEVALTTRLALSGITGKIVPNAEQAGAYTIDLAGGYGGVPGTLWTAKGGLDARAASGSIDLVAARFQLDRLSAILANSPVVDFQSTSVDTSVHIDATRDGVRFAGGFHLTGLNIGHPMLADKEVHDLDLSAQVVGSYERAAHKLDLTRGDFVARDVPFSITGTVVQPRAIARAIAALGKPIDPDPDAPIPPPPPELVPPKRLAVRFVIPPIECQRMLDAIPTEMAPYMAGYKLKGKFDTDVLVDIDWSNLDATVLDGHVGIKHCRVVDEPADSPKRLKEEFEHYVEVEKDEWTSFIVGPSNDDFVPIDQISPYLVKSIMTTEDSAFYQHHGFITSEFRTALVNDLKAGGFKFGASSITMQMVKNVLLYREKTLARKLQELFLTWHVENTLTKDRILEIYLNVIEYGPGLYGIGPASWHFFSKPPRDLNPVEAAFFSSILPAPKERYKQYCAGTLTKWTTGKIQRILGIMLKRDRLTQAEYDAAMATPLLFAKDGLESEDDCMKRVKKAIKNARSTNPLRK